MISDEELKGLKKWIIKLLLKIRQRTKDIELADIELKKEREFTSYIGYRFYYFHLQSFYIKKFKKIEFRYGIPESISQCGKSFIGKDGKFMIYADQSQLLEIIEYMKDYK